MVDEGFVERGFGVVRGLGIVLRFLVGKIFGSFWVLRCFKIFLLVILGIEFDIYVL